VFANLLVSEAHLPSAVPLVWAACWGAAEALQVQAALLERALEASPGKAALVAEVNVWA
jgi:hypothetical protein